VASRLPFFLAPRHAPRATRSNRAVELGLLPRLLWFDLRFTDDFVPVMPVKQPVVVRPAAMVSLRD
jgi:hypothetical protein